MTTSLPRLTPSGFILLTVVVIGFVLANPDGTHALNALIIPGAVAIVAAVLTVYIPDTPRLIRNLPPDGQQGEIETVHFTIESDATLATLYDQLPSGLDGDNAIEVVLSDGSVSYDVRYAERGEHAIGPAEIKVKDILGLAQRVFRIEETDTVIVFPRVHPLTARGREQLFTLVGNRDTPQKSETRHSPQRETNGHPSPQNGTRHTPERVEFDHLRQYEQGDILRDIQWKASAKHDELLVAEYVAADVADCVTITAEAKHESPATTGRTPADAMAEATASLAIALLDTRVPVTVTTPDGTVTASGGDRQNLLAHLARTTAGNVETDHESDVHIDASSTEVYVRLDDFETTFGALNGNKQDQKTSKDLANQSSNSLFSQEVIS